jgi:integrase/recombinase XerD
VPSPGKEGLSSLICRFLHHWRLKNHAPSYIAIAEHYLSDFACYLEGQGLYDIRSITKDDLASYLRSLKTRRRTGRKKLLAQSTIYTWWGIVRLFFQFLTSEGHLVYDPTPHIDRPGNGPKTTREPLPEEDIDALLSQPDIRQPIGLRDRALLELFYSTGIRSGELLALEIFDVDLVEKTVRIRKGKGSKERVLPLGAHAEWYLSTYLSDVRSRFSLRNPDEKTLFLSRNGRPLTHHALYIRFDRYKELSGIQSDVCPHILRHSCATHMLEGGADMFSLKELLGHSCVDTTQLYAKASPAHLKNVHRNCHPRGK